VRGATPDQVRGAIDAGDPLPGGYGFAGDLGGRVIRDVLGRELAYTERGDPTTWSHDPTDLRDPDLVPAGHARDAAGDERLWTLPDPAPTEDHDAALAAVESALTSAVDGAVDDETPIAFSGGVDSAAVAGRADGPLYVAGFEGCHDVAAARRAASAMGRDVTVVDLTHDDLRRATPEVARAIGRSNAMDVAIALPLYLVAERVVADGHDRLAVGQGADELFGGYAKVANHEDDRRIDADSVRAARRDTVLTLPDQLERDLRALRAAGVEPVAPLLHDDVVDAALRLPDELLVDGDERKVALRRAAAYLPDAVRARDKKAVQYGTYVSRELDRLARQNGFKRRMGDHVSKYVASLL
jgi:asparagine synthase (glutamine-hydrolysing)